MKKSCFRFLLLFVVTASYALADQELLCGGEFVDSDSVTQIDVQNSTLTVNTLHEVGGELRFGNIGTVGDTSLDLVVTVTGGDYTNIAQIWADKGKDESKNGKNAGFANINLQTVEGYPYSGQGDFEICFVESGTDEKVTLETFRWSVSDVDQRGYGDDVIQEELLFNVSQAHSFQLWPFTEVELLCEDGTTQTPCPEGIRTIFHSTEFGSGTDRPTNPDDMTEGQLKRTVEFTFQDTDCFKFTYDHYCPSERGTDPTMCKFYSGGNFLFSGVASISNTIHTGGMHDLSDILTAGDCYFPSDHS